MLGLTPVYADILNRIEYTKAGQSNKYLSDLIWILLILAMYALIFSGTTIHSVFIVFILIAVVCVVELHISTMIVRKVGK